MEEQKMGEIFDLSETDTKKEPPGGNRTALRKKVDNYIIAQKHKNSKPRGEINGSYYASHYSSRN